MKAIVTGGAGFIGSHLADRLIELGHEVIILDNLFTGKEKNVPKGATLRHVDISLWDELLLVEEDFKNTNVIFHLAASKKNISLRSPARDLAVNSGGTLMLLQMAIKHKVDCFIHASTGSVYGENEGIIDENTLANPVSYYGVSKLAGEGYVKLFANDMKIVILRYFHVFGSRQRSDVSQGGVVAIFSREIKEGGTIQIWGDGGQERVFTHVSNIVDSNIAAWQNPRSAGHVYNCASQERVTVGELAIKLMAYYKNKSIPIVYGEPLLGDIYNFTVNSRKIDSLGVKFMPFSEGIKLLT